MTRVGPYFISVKIGVNPWLKELLHGLKAFWNESLE